MNIDQMLFAFAGSMIVISLVIGYWINPLGFLLAAFVGLNMLQAAFTGFCPLARLLVRFGVKPGCAFGR